MMTNGDNRSGALPPHQAYGDLGGTQTLGMVVSGSLAEGMVVRLDADRSIEEIKVGTFVNIQGQHMRFFGVVTDAALASMDPGYADPAAGRIGPVYRPSRLRKRRHTER